MWHRDSTAFQMANYAMIPVTRKACPKPGRCNFGRACACSLCLLNHRLHKLSTCNAVPYRACVSAREGTTQRTGGRVSPRHSDSWGAGSSSRATPDGAGRPGPLFMGKSPNGRSGAWNRNARASTLKLPLQLQAATCSIMMTASSKDLKGRPLH